MRAANCLPQPRSPALSVYQSQASSAMVKRNAQLQAAESSRSRDFPLICGEVLELRFASRSLALSRGDFFKDASRHFLQFAKARQVVLKIVIEKLRILRAELGTQNHIAQLYGVGQQSIFLQFLERDFCVVVIHKFLQAKRTNVRIVLTSSHAAEISRKK